VVADVTHPIIGVDLLSHFGLLVDCRNNRLLDGVTWFAPAQAASALISSVKTISDGTPVDSLFAKFPNLTRPAGIQREVRHNIVHHIRTIPSPPVTCRPRLAPDRPAISKAEFEAMLRDGTARPSPTPSSRSGTKCSPWQFNHLDFVAQFTTDVVADALSRVESVTAPPSYDALAASQDSDELQTLLGITTALRLEKLQIPGTTVSIYCDTSAGISRSYVPAPLQLQVFQSVHDLSHPGTKATAKPVAQRFVWLPLVLLRIRMAFKEGSQASVAELVYGEPLRIPGELLASAADPVEPAHLITELRQHIACLRLVQAACHASPATFVHSDLEKCTHVFLRQDATRRVLEPPDSGPYQVLSCNSWCAAGSSPVN
jgi:hypothetical protein